jgi:hypothetical protein
MAEDMKKDMAQDKAMITKAFKMHDKQEHKGGKGTNLTKLAKGGKTNEMMKSYGRNMAKVVNQRGASRGG